MNSASLSGPSFCGVKKTQVGIKEQNINTWTIVSKQTMSLCHM